MTGRALRHDLGQILWVGFLPDGDDAVPRTLASRVARGEVGGVVLFARNLGEPGAVLELNESLHARAPRDAPLLVAVDQEGGRVQRIKSPATVWPPMAQLGAFAAQQGGAEASALARAVGEALGTELRALDFDVDFAPVLDVHTNPDNPVIGDRAFASTPDLVARLAGAFAEGLDAAGILWCGKHFPGHGDTALDSHLALPRVAHPRPRVDAVELAPFRALADRMPLVMTAHVIFDALDSRPATLSPAVLGTLLRGQLGFAGVIVADDLEMRAVADLMPPGPLAVAALSAGCDVLLVCKREDVQEEVTAGLLLAAETDPAFAARIADAAARVRTLKAGHARTRADRPRPPLSILGAAAHRSLALKLAAPADRLVAFHDPTDPM